MKIAIVGSHGVGKTSLMEKLEMDADFYNYTFYPIFFQLFLSCSLISSITLLTKLLLFFSSPLYLF